MRACIVHRHRLQMFGDIGNTKESRYGVALRNEFGILGVQALACLASLSSHQLISGINGATAMISPPLTRLITAIRLRIDFVSGGSVLNKARS